MEHECPLRSMIEGANYVSFDGLEEARRHKDATAIMQGDYGGSIYLTCPVSLIACSEATLTQLLSDVDSAYWDDPDGARVYFEPRPVGSGVAGGTGGGQVMPSLWLHTDLEALNLRQEIEEVLSGRRERVNLNGRNVFR
jgi:hypothetical protein